MIFKILYAFFSLCLLSFFSFFAQEFSVSYRFEQDTLYVKGGQTFSNKILLKNNSDKPVQLTSFSDDTVTLKGLITLPDTVFLEANEMKRLPLKYIASRATIKSNLQPFTIGFLSLTAGVTVQPPQSFYLKITEDGGLTIYTEQSEYYLDPL